MIYVSSKGNDQSQQNFRLEETSGNLMKHLLPIWWNIHLQPSKRSLPLSIRGKRGRQPYSGWRLPTLFGPKLTILHLGSHKKVILSEPSVTKTQVFTHTNFFVRHQLWGVLRFFLLPGFQRYLAQSDSISDNWQHFPQFEFHTASNIMFTFTHFWVLTVSVFSVNLFGEIQKGICGICHPAFSM